jgi:hypothetical protein
MLAGVGIISWMSFLVPGLNEWYRRRRRATISIEADMKWKNLTFAMTKAS